MMKHKAIITVSIMVLNILCLAQFAGGSGTIEDPYLIETADQLDQVRNYMTSSFRQIADIDLGVPPWNENGGWAAIAEYDPWDVTKSFRGNYDGNGFIIANMYRDTLSNSWAGLFGSTDGCLLENINLINFDIQAVGGTIGGITSISYNDNIINCYAEGKIKGSSQIGLLAAFFEGYSIKNCHVKGEINSSKSYIGGMIGLCYADSIINCSADIVINSEGGAYIGGLIGGATTTSRSLTISECKSASIISHTGDYGGVGSMIGVATYIWENLEINKSYCTGRITTNNDFIGGFIGAAACGDDSFLKIVNSYSNTNISGNESNGGFLGSIEKNVQLENCYSTGQVSGNTNAGGFIGSIDSLNTVTVTNSYWDMETSGIDSSAAGEGRTTAEMTLPYSENTYVDWDFVNVWRDDVVFQNNGYPTFQWVSGIEDNDDAFVAGVRGFELYQNYPNPFNPVTQIKFALAKTADVKLSVYNISGQKVAELANGSKQAGIHTVDFNGEKLNSGVYYYVLDVGNESVSKRMLMVK